ncbi:hypothetical protein COB55_06070 [Candidatus Wolfebacteria bacterium]|nr:MAG: hypothetical protein COB55_06070 [Candidatus Wolfebacteria bacterium]
MSASNFNGEIYLFDERHGKRTVSIFSEFGPRVEVVTTDDESIYRNINRGVEIVLLKELIVSITSTLAKNLCTFLCTLVGEYGERLSGDCYYLPKEVTIRSTRFQFNHLEPCLDLIQQFLIREKFQAIRFAISLNSITLHYLPGAMVAEHNKKSWREYELYCLAMHGIQPFQPR